MRKNDYLYSVVYTRLVRHYQTHVLIANVLYALRNPNSDKCALTRLTAWIFDQLNTPIKEGSKSWLTKLSATNILRPSTRRYFQHFILSYDVFHYIKQYTPVGKAAVIKIFICWLNGLVGIIIVCYKRPVPSGTTERRHQINLSYPSLHNLLVQIIIILS